MDTQNKNTSVSKITIRIYKNMLEYSPEMVKSKIKGYGDLNEFLNVLKKYNSYNEYIRI